ncbi:MAG: hypothetical protein WCJ37_15680 [Syntrophus sp. (in: bacteria)]
MQTISATKATIKNIGEIFEKGLQNEYLSRSIGKIIEYEKEKTIKEVNVLKEELSSFESTYQMSSEDFFERFEKGELGDKEAYFEWSAMYQMYERSIDRLNILVGPSV